MLESAFPVRVDEVFRYYSRFHSILKPKMVLTQPPKYPNHNTVARGENLINGDRIYTTGLPTNCPLEGCVSEENIEEGIATKPTTLAAHGLVMRSCYGCPLSPKCIAYKNVKRSLGSEFPQNPEEHAQLYAQLLMEP